MKMFNKNSPWYHKALAIGVVGLVTFGGPLAILAYELSGGPTPPPWEGEDWIPDEQWVCTDRVDITVEEVQDIDGFWSDLGWPEWPEPVSATNCPTIAPDGVAMWTSCTGFGCGGDGGEGGAVGSSRYSDGSVKSRTIALESRFTRRDCIPTHEAGHARGLIDPYDQDRHTTASSNLMAAECGPSLRWLDRTESGDWPYDQ